MYGIIITAHSKYASGVYSGLKLVSGDMENVKVVDYLESQSYEDLDANLEEAYYELIKTYPKVIFITDLLGGTPFSRSALNYGANENVRVLSGLNFPMLYSASVMQDSENMDTDIQEIMTYGKDGINVYKNQSKDTSKDVQEEDGI